ncbi:patched domain-containing protein 3 isoform X1 [Microplitis demolitor]|uniref:patched domain-containing protein 3 isoform X1 n=1 Tax=Microplitis demolitor TaxID=69319 RepID=UPI0006D5205B|nr:patched domain-containing protein 3 isoform X1 [Microplitis demolitor]
MESPRKSSSSTRTCRDSIVNFKLNYGKIFNRIGLSIGNKPWVWLIASLCISGVCGPGLSLWREEVDPIKSFIPVDSIIRKDAAWVKEHFNGDLRYESIIVTAPNVLDPQVLEAINEIENSVKSIVVQNQTWHDVCAEYLTWFENGETNIDNDTDQLLIEELSPLKTLMSGDSCIYQSILKVFRENESHALKNLTRESILEDVTAALRDTEKGNILTDISPLLSRVEYDKSGRVIGAKATILNWILKKSNIHSPEWELEFIERTLYSNRSLPEGMKIYAVAKRSFIDCLNDVMRNNISILCCGLFIIVAYVIIMIGKCNPVQQRIYLSLLGVSVVGQAILSGFGVCFYLGYAYGPIHSVLPFVLLGIGVDDMFVIIQSLDSLTESEKNLTIPERIARALEQSGMSITTTSLTNIIAFAIGMTTVMPFLSSFCMFATMGIFFLFIFEIMFFVSCLVLDERRLAMKRDGCFCQSKIDWKPNECSQKNLQKQIFEKFIGPFAMRPKVKIFIILITATALLINAWGIYNLGQHYDPLLYLNQESYPLKFNNKLIEYFPKYGKRASVYLAGIDYYEDREALGQLINVIAKHKFVNNKTLDPWFIAYSKWLNNKTREIDRDEYYGSLSEYLLTRKGQSYVKDIKFSRLPTVDYNITTSKFEIQHIHINTTADQLHAMQSIREIIKSVDFKRGIDHAAIFSQEYISWTANKIIGDELTRNLCLEILAVSLVTVILLRDIKVSFWVICCVVFTLIDLLGSLYYLGLTIEISSSIIILMCAGLAVDYAAHVGLEFTRVTGTRDERSIATLGAMGPAVFNGGLSTFLAFVLLGVSKAYLFSTFFKLFTSVVVFGLFHGLLFLPVILSICGSNEKPKEVDVKTDHTTLDSNKYSTIPIPSSTNNNNK